MQSLRREVDLLRENVLKAEAVTKSAKRIYSDERDRLRELQGQFRDADKIRQEAYIHLKNLRKQSYEKVCDLRVLFRHFLQSCWSVD